MPKFVDRMVGRGSQDDEGDEIVRDAEVVPRKPTVSRLAEYTAAQEHSPEEPAFIAPAVSEEEPKPRTTDSEKVGEHVASVLEAAKSAAAKIVEDAVADAERLADEIAREASLRLENVRREADQLAEKNKETTERATAYETKLRLEAEEQASAIVARAEEEASDHHRATQERHATLAQNLAASEERLEQLVTGLRDLAAGLEELLAGKRAAATADDAPLPDRTSLEESLRPSATVESNYEPS